MLVKNSIQILSLEKSMEKEKLVISIQVKNSLDRTLYAYGRPRRIFYNKATGKLTLYLHDHRDPGEEPISSPHLKEPNFVQLEGKTTTEIKIKLDPVIQRIRSAAERGNGPLFEELPISEAKEVYVEIAHQDTPFYYNPKINNSQQLQEWGKIMSKANFKIKPFSNQ